MKWGKRETVADTNPEKYNYFSLLLAEDDSGEHNDNSKKIEKALEYAHDIRKFEIELFWKRSTYFWVFISVIILAYGGLLNIFVVKETEGSIKLFLFLAIVIFNNLGLIISYIWYRAMEGSKFWQKNWEAHIDMLEFYVTGHLHKVLFERSTRQTLSVSKLSQVVALFCIIAWGLLLLVSPAIYWHKEPCIAVITPLLSIIIVLVARCRIIRTCKSTSANQGFQ